MPIPGFYDDGISLTAVNCHRSCKSCNGALKTNCDECDINNKRVNKN